MKPITPQEYQDLWTRINFQLDRAAFLITTTHEAMRVNEQTLSANGQVMLDEVKVLFNRLVTDMLRLVSIKPTNSAS